MLHVVKFLRLRLVLPVYDMMLRASSDDESIASDHLSLRRQKISFFAYSIGEMLAVCHKFAGEIWD